MTTLQADPAAGAKALLNRTTPALPPEHAVRPEPGRLVLFPSYLWHGTVPFTGADSRLTVAFDLVPA